MDGVTFQNACSVAFGTGPSHASLFTSLYAREHGLYNNRTILRDSFLTLAEVLKEKGYSTGGFVSAPTAGSMLGFGQGFDVFEDFNGQRAGDETASLALDWIRGVQPPFFLWAHFYDPHQPYNPPPEYLKRSPGENTLKGAWPEQRMPVDFTRRVRAEHHLEKGMEAFQQVHREARRRYLGEIEFMDAQISRILAELDAGGHYDRSLIAVVSDHGENFFRPDPKLAFDHLGLHSGVVRLAAVLKPPQSRQMGVTSNCLIGNLDFAPTLIAVLGFDPPAAWSGQNAAACLEDESTEFRKHLVLEGNNRREWSVRTKRWVYRELRHPKAKGNAEGYEPGETHKIYDLSTDPSEIQNLAGSPESIRQRKLFRRLLAKFSASSDLSEVQILDDPEELEALRALGYVQ
jgi:arylsulfatase A-like enzyme